MAVQTQVVALGGTQMSIGLSAIISVKTAQYQSASTIKIVAGSGTLWITPIPLTLTGTPAASLMLTGYPLGASEVFSVGGPASFYLSAAGATMTIGMIIGYSSGVSLI